MYIEAGTAAIGQKAGEMLTECAKGIVIGPFKKAIYCKIERMGVLLLHDMILNEIDFGIGLSDAELVFSGLGLKTGAVVRLGADKLSFEDSWGLITGLRINPQLYQKAAGKPIILTGDLQSRLNEALRLLKLHGTFQGVAGLSALIDNKTQVELNMFCRAAQKPLFTLIEGITTNKHQNIFYGLNGLLGLGIGLTPSMDDFLAGMACTFRHILAFTGWSPNGWDYFCWLLSKLSITKTSEISAAYLTAVVSGKRFYILDEAAKAFLLYSNDKNAFCESICSLLRLGSSSGSDMLTGCIFAVNTALNHNGGF